MGGHFQGKKTGGDFLVDGDICRHRQREGGFTDRGSGANNNIIAFLEAAGHGIQVGKAGWHAGITIAVIEGEFDTANGFNNNSAAC